jgi:CcmD family protein
MRPALRPLFTIALAAVCGASMLAAAQAQPPVSDAALPATIEPAADARRVDMPVATSLRQDVPQEPPERFKPLDELPPAEQYPAGPLIVAAYSFVMLALFAYLLSVARRLGGVQREVERLERDLKNSGRA